MSSVELGISGDCELKSLEKMEGWEWLKDDSRFEFAESCDFRGISESIILYGFEESRGDIIYRDYFVATKEGNVLRLGLVFPPLAGSNYDLDLQGGRFFTLQSSADVALTMMVYSNAIKDLEDCMSREQCVKNLLNSYGLWGRIFDGQYKNFRREFLSIKNKERLINDLPGFEYDEEMNRLSFVVAIDGTRWYLELSLLPTGEVDELTRVSPLIA